MKAGAFTPATPDLDFGEVGLQNGPLNEGGGFHPRNPRSSQTTPPEPPSLNEGGGFHPRNPSMSVNSSPASRTLNEGGGFHPRNPAPKTFSIHLRDFWPEQDVILTDHTL